MRMYIRLVRATEAREGDDTLGCDTEGDEIESGRSAHDRLRVGYLLVRWKCDRPATFQTEMSTSFERESSRGQLVVGLAKYCQPRRANMAAGDRRSV